jgi:hypothetical protein
MASGRYKTLFRQIGGNNDKGNDLTQNTGARPAVRKFEIYEALYGLNAGIQQFMDSLDFLDRVGLGVPFMNGYRILADEIRSAINFSTTEVLAVIELHDYKELENQRAKFAFPSGDNLTTELKKHD